MHVSIVMYNLFLWLYKTGIHIVSPWNPKAKRWLKGRKNILKRISALNPGKQDRYTWMHCASLGEFEQGRPILENIRKQYPAEKIVLTFFSPSGYEAKKDYAGADHILYLPLDSKRNAQFVVNALQPKLVIWVKYEYWYYYLDELKRQNIPTILVSANFQPGQPFFQWHGKLYRYMLGCFTWIFVQNEASLKLLEGIGYSGNASLSGDTRFDRVIAIAEQFEPVPLVDQFCADHPVIVAGSTWEEDEEELDHYANTHPEIRFIIAPHEIDEPHLKDIEGLFQRTVRYSQLEKLMANDSKVNVLIIDNIGMLSRLYKYATIAYLGGGFGEDGVHNVLEAAVYGRPVVYGPVIDKFVEAIELADTVGGIVVDSALEAETVFNRLLSNRDEYLSSCEAAKEYVYSKKGATGKIIRYIQENRLLTN
jgi:3-deoxy-D-manno-octulosonic-acid transferase